MSIGPEKHRPVGPLVRISGLDIRRGSVQMVREMGINVAKSPYSELTAVFGFAR